MTEDHHFSRARYAVETSQRPVQPDRDTAHQAAEALFSPKRQMAEPSTLATGFAPDQTARRPRILSASSAQPNRPGETNGAVAPVPPKPREQIPATHAARVRTWLKRGMTTPQVAKVYGVTVDEIERILQKAR